MSIDHLFIWHPLISFSCRLTGSNSIMNIMIQSIPRLSALLCKKLFPMSSPGQLYCLAYSLMKRSCQCKTPSTSTQWRLERYLRIITKHWSRLAGVCLQQYTWSHPLQRSSKGINTWESTRGRNLSGEKVTEYARPWRSTSVSLYEDMAPNWKLGDAVSFLEGEKREPFQDLVKGMLAWHPDVRKPAG